MTDFEKMTGTVTGMDASAVAGMHRREAIKRVSLLLGGVAFVGGSQLLTACAGDRPPAADSTQVAAKGQAPIGEFSVADQQFGVEPRRIDALPPEEIRRFLDDI